MSPGEKALVAGILLASAVVASRLANRLSVPALLLFLAIGMVIGSDAIGWVNFSDYGLAKTFGIFALALILFDGGLRAGWPEIRPVVGISVSLAVIGTIVSAAITGFVAAPLLGISTLEGLLLGAVLSPTDGAAVFALLRGSRLKHSVERALEGESGFNDPIAVLLVILLIEAITNAHNSAGDIALTVFNEIGFGIAFGVLIGLAAVAILKRLHLDSSGLYPVATIAFAAISFGAADALGGSGFLAIYLTGLTIGGKPIPARRTVEAFHDGLAWLAQVALFMTLGLLVFPSHFDSVALEGTAIALVLALVARPVATAIACLPFRLPWREVVLIGWAGLRGAVPVVLATFVVVGHVPDAQNVFDIVFFAVVVSTLLQGATVKPLAKRLGLTKDEPPPVASLRSTAALERMGARVLQFSVKQGDAIVGERIRDLGLPRETLVNLIVRDGSALPPRGSTVVEAGDELRVMMREESEDEVAAVFTHWRTGLVADTSATRTHPL